MPRPEQEGGKLYALCPGPVRSKHDGDWHYISATRLAALYGVPMHQCEIVVGAGLLCSYTGSLIPLYPRHDGDYSVARVIQEMSWE